MNRRRLLALPIMLLVVAVDQVTKWLILNRLHLPDEHGSLAILPFFSLVKWWNHGVSFGLFNALHTPESQRVALIFLTLAIIGVLVVSLMRTTQWLAVVALGMILGGAFGNLIDRFHYGAVADFLYFHYKQQYDFPAFNVADSCVSIGVGLLLVDGLGLGRRKSASFIDT